MMRYAPREPEMRRLLVYVAQTGLVSLAGLCLRAAEAVGRLDDRQVPYRCVYERCSRYGRRLEPTEVVRTALGGMHCTSCLRPARAMTRSEAREARRPAPSQGPASG